MQKMDPEAAESMRQFFRDHGCILKDSVWIIPGSVFSVESLDPETSIRGIGKKRNLRINWISYYESMAMIKATHIPWILLK